MNFNRLAAFILGGHYNIALALPPMGTMAFFVFFPVKLSNLAFAFDPASRGRLHWYGLQNKTFYFFLKFTQLCSYCLLSSLYGRLQ